MGVCTVLAILTSIVSTVSAQDAAPKKVSKSEGLSNAIAKVQPDYPSVARQLKIEGAVELEALVTESGTVERVNIVSGNPLLTRPAADAVKKWKFAPFLSAGKAIKALVPVGLSYKL